MMDLSDRRVAAAVARLVRGLVDVTLRDRIETRLYGTVFGPPDLTARKVAVQIRGQAEPSAGFSYGQVVPKKGDYVRVVIDPKGDRYVDEVLTAPAATSMPADPLEGERAWRSDYGMEFYWDGDRWLSSQVFVQSIPAPATISADAFLGHAAPPIHLLGGVSDLFMLDAIVSARGGSPNNASNYWVWAISKVDGIDATGVDFAVSVTSGVPADTWGRYHVPLNALLGTQYDAWRLWAGKVGSPGTLQIGAAVTYRLVL